MMRAFILSLSGKIQVILIIGLTLILAFTSAAVCSLFFDVHQLITNTDLISSVYDVMGTVYAILLTFTLWGVWQNFNEAGASVQNEAYAILDLIHMLETSSGKKSNNINNVREAALAYATLVVTEEWSMLKDLKNDIVNLRERTHTAWTSVIHEIKNITPQDEREMIIFDKTLTLMNRWLDARRTRILIARGNSAKALWPLLLIGALVLFAFHGLFVAKTLAIWAALLFGISLVIGVTFYLIFSLDCPFAGSLSINSEPFKLAINVLKESMSNEK